MSFFLNVGTATATITFKELYEGSADRTFTITRKAVTPVQVVRAVVRVNEDCSH